MDNKHRTRRVRAVAAVIVGLVALTTGRADAAPATTTPPSEPSAIDDSEISTTEINFLLWAVGNDIDIERAACSVDRTTQLATCYGLVAGVPAAYEAPPTDNWSHFTPIGAPATGAPTTTVAVGANDASFVLDFNEATAGQLELAGEYSTAAADALDDADVAEAALQAQLAADTYKFLHDTAIASNGADSAIGQATVMAMATCQAAWQASADALTAFDVEAINAATESLNDCTEQLNAATALLN
jgi:hypothetical protein